MDQLQDESTTKSVEEITHDSTFSVLTELNVPDNNRVLDQPAEFDTKREFDSDGDEAYMLKEGDPSTDLQEDHINEAEKDIEELELVNLFFEDSSSSATLYPEILQQKEKNLSEFAYRHNLGSIDDIWMKVN